ncbi:hypothetical protein B0H13DRAFT_2557685 [Mycena leptocephala]|nr:hypothetical protein B0H13DRAFT_2557685 [Mycena leptocephala]
MSDLMPDLMLPSALPMRSRMFPMLPKDCHQCLRDKVQCGACIQATIATQLVRPVRDDFGLNAEDVGGNGHRQLGAFADAFPPFTNSIRNAELIRNGLRVTQNRHQFQEPAKMHQKIAVPKRSRRSIHGTKNSEEQPRRRGLRLRGCYEILRKHFRTADHTQLDDHLDRYWTILHNSVTPVLGLPTVAPIMLNLPNRSPSVQPEEELEFQYPPTEPILVSSGSHLSSRSPSIQPEEELELQYTPSEPVHLSSVGLGSAGSLPASNPCRNVPGLWFVKVGADAAKILEIKFVFEPEFTPGLDLPQFEPSASAAQESPAKSQLSVVLLCIRTAAVSTLHTALEPTPERLTAAVAGLEMAWPRDGTLFLDINHGGKNGKSWIPCEIDPAVPLDVTSFIQPGLNIIRLIQLTSMADRTFILYACREPEPALQNFDYRPPQNADSLFDFPSKTTYLVIRVIDIRDNPREVKQLVTSVTRRRTRSPKAQPPTANAGKEGKKI